MPKIELTEEKEDIIKDIYAKALAEIAAIKKERDSKIAELLKKIDARQMEEILKKIKVAKKQKNKECVSSLCFVEKN